MVPVNIIHLGIYGRFAHMRWTIRRQTAEYSLETKLQSLFLWVRHTCTQVIQSINNLGLHYQRQKYASYSTTTSLTTTMPPPPITTPMPPTSPPTTPPPPKINKKRVIKLALYNWFSAYFRVIRPITVSGRMYSRPRCKSSHVSLSALL